MGDMIKLNHDMQESKENEILRMMNDTSLCPLLAESEVVRLFNRLQRQYKQPWAEPVEVEYTMLTLPENQCSK